MDQGSISIATKRQAFYEARRSNVQARSESARKLTRSDKREVTALDRKPVVPWSSTQQIKAGVGGILFSKPKILLKKQEVDGLLHRLRRLEQKNMNRRNHTE
jgi:hypothetical protein